MCYPLVTAFIGEGGRERVERRGRKEREEGGGRKEEDGRERVE